MSNPLSLTELRDPALVRQWIAQGLWLARIVPPRAAPTATLLDWAVALSSEGEPLPPIGFLADVGHLIFRASAEVRPTPNVHQKWPTALLRAYEDYALGKLLADSRFERAGDALRQYQGQDRIKGLTFVLQQMHARVGYAGVALSPGTLKSLRSVDAGELLAEGWESIEEQGVVPLLTEMYGQLVREFRNSADLLGPEDVFELERRTALAQFGQRIALRQVLQAAKMLDESLPRQKPRPEGRRFEVPTRLLEENTYPVGGFASISTRGSIESLLHSQLAYMERGERPDLFDVKFLRDELLFYSRDENSFLRRRRTFVFALYPDVVDARVKDAELPYQRIILLLALVYVAIGKLIEWLHTDAMDFEIILLDGHDAPGLASERELFEVLLAEQIANGTVCVETLEGDRLSERLMTCSRRSLCQCLLASSAEKTLDLEGAVVSRLVIDGAAPWLGLDEEPVFQAEDAALPAWIATLERLLMQWI